MTTGTLNLTSSFSPVKTYFYALDQIDAKIGRMAAVISYFVSPLILSSVVFVPGVLLEAYNFQQVFLTAPLLVISTIAYFGIIIKFRTLVDQYASEDLEQIMLNSKGKTKNALIIESGDWSNGAPLEFGESFLDSLIGDFKLCFLRYQFQKIEKTHSIHHFVAHPERDWDKALGHLINKTIDLVWIRGHGSQDGMLLNKDFFFDGKSKASNTLIESIAKKIQNQTTFILSGCKTGRGNLNIAKILSAFYPKATIHAPQDSVNEAMQNFSSSDFFPYFSNGWGKKVMTSSYCNGTELPHSVSKKKN